MSKCQTHTLCKCVCDGYEKPFMSTTCVTRPVNTILHCPWAALFLNKWLFGPTNARPSAFQYKTCFWFKMIWACNCTTVISPLSIHFRLRLLHWHLCSIISSCVLLLHALVWFCNNVVARNSLNVFIYQRLWYVKGKLWLHKQIKHTVCHLYSTWTRCNVISRKEHLF